MLVMARGSFQSTRSWMHGITPVIFYSTHGSRFRILQSENHAKFKTRSCGIEKCNDGLTKCYPSCSKYHGERERARHCDALELQSTANLLMPLDERLVCENNQPADVTPNDDKWSTAAAFQCYVFPLQAIASSYTSIVLRNDRWIREDAPRKLVVACASVGYNVITKKHRSHRRHNPRNRPTRTIHKVESMYL